MTEQHWQIEEPFAAVIFDCDGTLSTIEGIDYLAQLSGVYDEVSRLTQKAMAETGLTPDLYQQRLQLVKPTFANVSKLGDAYCQHMLPDIAEVIRILQLAGKAIFILSAGLKPAVAQLGQALRVPYEHVHAVDISFDQYEAYQDFDHTSPLIHNDGKATFVHQIKERYHRLLYVGDGLNDIAVAKQVTRFVGFGGAFYRENIAKLSDFYITAYPALLPLALTELERKRLPTPALKLYEDGIQLIKNSAY